VLCWSCKKEIEVPQKISRKDACPNCGVDLKCCYNCQLYDKDAFHQCHETEAEWVRYKEKGNFCEFFEPGTRPVKSAGDEPQTKENLKRKWDSLFRDEG